LANAPHEQVACPLRTLRDDPTLRQTHLSNLPVQSNRIRGRIDPHLAIARAKIEDARSFDEAVGFLNSRETFAVLGSPVTLQTLFELPATEGKGKLALQSDAETSGFADGLVTRPATS
jgi:membrane glycosyltransferase